MESENLDNIKEKIVELETRISNLEQVINARTANFGTDNSESGKKMSIREFINLINPKNNVEKVLAIAYYKETVQSTSRFSVKDIADGFKEAKEPAPDNINLPIYYNVQRGYLMENNFPDSKLKNWELTNSGIKVIKERISDSKT